MALAALSLTERVARQPLLGVWLVPVATRRRFGLWVKNGVVTIRTEGLTHLHLAVRDLDQSLRFYQGVFGMQELFREGEGMVFLRTPGAADTVTLRRSASSNDRPGDGGGIGHFGFRLVDEEDLDRAIEEVERAGGRLIRRGEHPDGQPFAYVTDPDGYMIEL